MTSRTSALAWLYHFDIEFLHQRAFSEPPTQEQWDSYETRLPWPGMESLRQNRRDAKLVHDLRRSGGQRCKDCRALKLSQQET